MKKYIAELFGTFVLVLVGCGTVVFSAPYVGNTGIALAFGLAVMAMVYAIGPVSGAHVNPAVTLGVWSAGRMKFGDVLGYVAGQFAGAALGAYVIIAIANGHLSGYDVALNGLGQNGWGENYASGYNMTSAILFEFIATFIFVKVILRTTADNLKIAGVVIGLTLTVIHILGLQITGVSVNPARSFGPAVFVGGEALTQLWLFLVVPSVAGLIAGLASRCCCGCCGCCKGGECTCGDNCQCGEGCTCQIPAAKKETPAEVKAPRRYSPRRNNTRRSTSARGQSRR